MKIAVIDSGVPKNTNMNIYKKCRVFTDKNLNTYIMNEKNECEDEHGHATIIYNILEMYIPNWNVLDIKILNKNLKSHSISLIKAIEIAIKENVDIINLSLGTTNKNYEQRLHDVVKRAVLAGIIIVAAEENNGIEAIPASFKEVIGVKGIYKDYRISDYEINFENNTIICGVLQKLKWIDGRDCIMNVTSFVTPHIAGQIGKILEGYKIDRTKILHFI